MKILFVGNAKSVHLRRWVSFFNKKGHKVKIVSPVEETIDGVEVIFWKRLMRGNLLTYIFSRVPGLGFLITIIVAKNLLNREKPDVLHIHYLSRVGISFSYANYKPTVISLWGSDIRIPKELPKYSLAKWIRRKALEKVAVVTTTSEFLAKESREFDRKISNLVVIPFGVNLGQFHPLEVVPKRSSAVTIGFAKNLKDIYGLDILLKALKSVFGNFTNVRVLIAGLDYSNAKYRRIAQKLGLGNKITFLGEVAHSEMPGFFSQLDIFLMPTLVPESFGVSALESQAMKVPVIASNTGGIPEVVDNQNTGILVPPGKVKPLAGAITKLVRSRDLREKMGELGRKYVAKKYNWVENAREMEDLYLGLISKR